MFNHTSQPAGTTEDIQIHLLLDLLMNEYLQMTYIKYYCTKLPWFQFLEFPTI